MKVKHSAKTIAESEAARAALMRLITAVVVCFMTKTTPTNRPSTKTSTRTRPENKGCRVRSRRASRLQLGGNLCAGFGSTTMHACASRDDQLRSLQRPHRFEFDIGDLP